MSRLTGRWRPWNLGVLAFVILVSFTSPAPAQLFQRGSISVEGRVFPAKGQSRLPAVVTMNLLGEGLGYRSTARASAGMFRFSGVPKGGRYTLTAEAEGFTPGKTSFTTTSATGYTYFINVQLGQPLPEKDIPPAGNQTVDLHSLQVPKEAFKELDRAVEELKADRPEHALQHLKTALELHPKFYQAYNNMALVYLKLDRKEDALGAMEKAVEINPDNGIAQRNLGGLLLDMGRNEDSLPYLSKATRLLETDPLGPFFHAEALFRLKRFLEAEGSCQLALERSPEAPRINYQMAWILLRLNRIPEAARQFDHTLEVDRENKLDRDELIRVSTRLKEFIAQQQGTNAPR